MTAPRIPQWAPAATARAEFVPARVAGGKRARGLRHAFYVVDRWLMYLLLGPDPLDTYRPAPRSMGWGAVTALRADPPDVRSAASPRR